MFIDRSTIDGLLIAALVILAACCVACYVAGMWMGERREQQAQADDGLPFLPPEPLTVKLKHVPPTTAELFAMIEAEGLTSAARLAAAQPPIGQLVQPRYGQRRTTEAIEAMTADTTRWLADRGITT